jgi:cytoskeleton protein RodZ
MMEIKAAALGAELRTARQSHGWELPQLAASLRIRQSYLEAIEAGRIGDLPGATYALGFVRAYASALGLPGEEMAKRFRAETALADGEQPALRFPAPVPQRGVPAGALMLLGFAILAGAYGGWYWVTEHRATPVEIVPPIPDRMATETPKPLPSPQVASLLPATSAPTATAPGPAPGFTGNSTPASGASTVGAPVAAPGLLPQPPRGAGPVLPGTAPSSGVAASGGALPASAPFGSIPGVPPGTASATPQPGGPAAAAIPGGAAAANAAPAVIASGGSRIVIKATADAWITVRQKSGPPLFNKLMRAGDEWPVPPGKDGLTLTTGNAGGTQIDVDGQPIGAILGGSGGVRRDLPLDADMLKSGKLPPPPPRHAKPVPASSPTPE